MSWINTRLHSTKLTTTPPSRTPLFHTDFNYYATSRYNNDPTTYSDYGWVPGYGIADIGIGIGNQDQSWDVTFLVKNLFDVQAKSYGFSNGILDSTPRWVGVLFTSKILPGAHL